MRKCAPIKSSANHDPIRLILFRIGAGVLLGFVACLAPSVRAEPNLWPLLEKLKRERWVDLTHTFDSTIPHWKGLPMMEATTLYDHEKDGFRIQRYSFGGQWGTHIDPPIHFHAGLRTQDQIDVTEMILPIVLFDVHEKVTKNHDYQLSLRDVEDWERKHGAVPAGSFAVMRTDWSKRWPDQKKLQNADAKGVFHYPGWSKEALAFLYEKRKITASGHETSDTDPGSATSKDDYSLESYVLGTNHYQIEFLDNLDQVPEAGAIAVLSWPKVREGSGFPARIFAIVPK